MTEDDKVKVLADALRKVGEDMGRAWGSLSSGMRSEPKPGKPEKEPLLKFLRRSASDFFDLSFAPFRDTLHYWRETAKDALGYWYCSGCDVQHGPRVYKHRGLFGVYCSLWLEGGDDGEAFVVKRREHM